MIDNSKAVWDYLISKIGNPIGVAAVMGNLMAESSLSASCATGLTKTGYTSVLQYILACDDGVHDFANDGVAFGLAQWCFRTRKQGLLDLAKKEGVSIGNLDMQLEYLWKEMIGYKTVWNAVVNATSIREASDIVMLKYEKPADTGESARAKRAAYGQKYFDRYAGGLTEKVVRVTDNNVNVRIGPSKSNHAICRANKNDEFRYYGTNDNGWNGIVLWLHPDYSEVISK